MWPVIFRLVIRSLIGVVELFLFSCDGVFGHVSSVLLDSSLELISVVVSASKFVGIYYCAFHLCFIQFSQMAKCVF